MLNAVRGSFAECRTNSRLYDTLAYFLAFWAYPLNQPIVSHLILSGRVDDSV